MHLEIPPIELEPAGARLGAHPDAWLRARVTILGVDHHAQAISVRRRRGGRQRPEAEVLTWPFQLVRAATSKATPFQTVRINDRDYVLVLTPENQ